MKSNDKIFREAVEIGIPMKKIKELLGEWRREYLTEPGSLAQLIEGVLE